MGFSYLLPGGLLRVLIAFHGRTSLNKYKVIDIEPDLRNAGIL